MTVQNGIENSASLDLALEYLKDRENADRHFNENKERYANEWLEKNTRTFDNHNMLFIDAEEEQHAFYLNEQRQVIESALERTGDNLRNMADSVESLGEQVAIDQYVDDQRVIIEKLAKEKQIAEDRLEKARQDLKELAKQYNHHQDVYKNAEIELKAQKNRLDVMLPQYQDASKQIAKFYREPKNERMHDNISDGRHVRYGQSTMYGSGDAANHALQTARKFDKRIELLNEQSNLENDPLIKERIQVQIAMEHADFKAHQNERISMLTGGDSQKLAIADQYNKQADAMALKASGLDLQLEQRGLIVDFTKNEIETRKITQNETLKAQGLSSTIAVLDVYREQLNNTEKADLRVSFAASRVQEIGNAYGATVDEADAIKLKIADSSEKLKVEAEKLKQLEELKTGNVIGANVHQEIEQKQDLENEQESIVSM